MSRCSQMKGFSGMKLVDTFPTNQYKGLEYRVGRVFPFGASLVEDNGVNFSIFSSEAKSCSLLLFHHGDRKPYAELPFPDEFRIGNVFTMMVFGIPIETTEYGYRFDGVNNPRAGLLYDRKRVLLDPYAKSVSGRSVWGRKPADTGSFVHRGQIIREDYDWEGDKPLETPLEDLVIYEMHVRGFTQDDSSGVHHRGTFAGIVEKIPYLKWLGVNCVELMPVFEFDELEYAGDKKRGSLLNYWGYSTVCFFAPKAGYAASAPFGMEADEFKNMVKKLHQNGIEVILDVVFNHTAEGNENGPVISYKGIDNRTYYMLENDGKYQNLTGCGNTMNCNKAVVRNHILDCLRYWVYAYHIDGFRFDLASILTRGKDGTPLVSPPLIDTLAHDTVLGRTKLIAEAWDAGGLYQVGNFPSWNRWSEWNGKYRDCVRRFVKGDSGCAPELFLRISGSGDLYKARGPAASINFITCHDGFTMYDLVSYNDKHNEANLENNQDGANDNNSWNCGAEGSTDDSEVNALRLRQIRNFLTLLLTSRGVPMLLSGDEFANTQFGNNNAYCQDNEISWLDWTYLDAYHDLTDYVRTLLALRAAHPVLRARNFDDGKNGTGLPELSFRSPDARKLDKDAHCLTFAVMYAEDHAKYGTERDAFLYIMINAHWEEHDFALPVLPGGIEWKLVCDSKGVFFPAGEETPLIVPSRFTLGPRESAVLIGM